MQQGVQMGVTCNIQQCWELLANNIVSVIDVYEIIMLCPFALGLTALSCCCAIIYYLVVEASLKLMELTG